MSSLVRFCRSDAKNCRSMGLNGQVSENIPTSLCEQTTDLSGRMRSSRASFPTLMFIRPEGRAEMLSPSSDRARILDTGISHITTLLTSGNTGRSVNEYPLIEGICRYLNRTSSVSCDGMDFKRGGGRLFEVRISRPGLTRSDGILYLGTNVARPCFSRSQSIAFRKVHEPGIGGTRLAAREEPGVVMITCPDLDIRSLSIHS